MNSTLISPLSTAWLAEYAPPRPPDPGPLSPVAVDARWTPLRQSWLSGAPERSFNPGWARIQWNDTEFYFDAILLGSQPANRALRLNERTWEIGDVCEIFLQAVDASSYLELHVTPENQRLQLSWPPGGLERFRTEGAAMEEFTVKHPDWVKTSTHVGPGFWVAHATIPLSCLGLDSLAGASGFRTAVCRYDCGAQSTPVISTTALLHEADFHRRHEWQHLVLQSTSA